MKWYLVHAATGQILDTCTSHEVPVLGPHARALGIIVLSDEGWVSA